MVTGTAVSVYRDGRNTSPTSISCTGFRERSPDFCDVTFDEDCSGVDMFGPYTFGWVGTISQVASDRHEGVVQVEFLEYYSYPFNCVIDITFIRQ